MNTDTQLATQNTGLIQSLPEMDDVAKKLSASGLMGPKTTPEMVFGLMLLCQCEGLNPIAAMKRYHIVEGRPSMRADAMQAEFLAHGGAIIFHVRTDEMVAATLFSDKTKVDDAARKRAKDRFATMWALDCETDDQKRAKLMVEVSEHSIEGEETIIRTFADCQAKGITEGRDGTKANWKTSPRQMLTARVITEGVRLVNPGLIAGIYNEDETADIVRQEKEARETPISPEVKERIEMKVEAMIDEAATTDDDLERQRLHKEAIRLEKEVQAASPESIAIRKYEDENPEHRGRVAGASQNPDGTWSITLLDTAPKSPLPKAARQRRTMPSSDENTPWREVVCNIGQRPGTMADKTLEQIFIIGKVAPKNQDQLEKLVGWFVTQAVHTSPKESDKALWKGVQEAKAELSAAFTAGASTAPASAETTPKVAEAPQPPNALPGWRDYVVKGKSSFTGKKLGDIPVNELKRIKIDYLAKLPNQDRQKWTIEQKALAANIDLALAELLPPAENEEEEPAGGAEHTEAILTRIAADSLNRNDVMSVCKKEGYIDPNHIRIEDITPEEAAPLIDGWAAVSAEVKAAQP